MAVHLALLWTLTCALQLASLSPGSYYQCCSRISPVMRETIATRQDWWHSRNSSLILIKTVECGTKRHFEYMASIYSESTAINSPQARLLLTSSTPGAISPVLVVKRWSSSFFGWSFDSNLYRSICPLFLIHMEFYIDLLSIPWFSQNLVLDRNAGFARTRIFLVRRISAEWRPRYRSDSKLIVLVRSDAAASKKCTIPPI